MTLSKIKPEDLIFSNELCDDRTNTYLNLSDYDWMKYVLSTRFNTEAFGILNVEFEYFGLTSSTMSVSQTINGVVEKVTYEYPTDIFSKHIIRFMQAHISSWGERYAFNGESYVIDFFNEVLEVGKPVENE